MTNFRAREIPKDDVPAVIEKLEQSLRRRNTFFGCSITLVFGAIGLLLILIANTNAEVGCFGVPGTLFVWSIIFLPFARRHGRALDKLRFVNALHGLLADELATGSTVLLDFDLRHYDHEGGGRKFTDKWLHYRATLADGSRLELVRQAGIKEKKGTLVKEKRRLFVELRPNPRVHSLLGELTESSSRTKQLRHLLKESCREFHNSPEDFDAKVVGEKGVLRIKVRQDDAPILAREVMILLSTVYEFLGSLKEKK